MLHYINIYILLIKLTYILYILMQKYNSKKKVKLKIKWFFLSSPPFCYMAWLA